MLSESVLSGRMTHGVVLLGVCVSLGGVKGGTGSAERVLKVVRPTRTVLR